MERGVSINKNIDKSHLRSSSIKNSSEKENRNKINTECGKQHAPSRLPLIELHDYSNKQRDAVTKTNKTDKSKLKKRSCSVRDDKCDKKYQLRKRITSTTTLPTFANIDKQNITFRKPISPFSKEGNTVLDTSTVFISGEQHIAFNVNYNTFNNISPIKPNYFTSRNTLIFESARVVPKKPAVKNSLLRKKKTAQKQTFDTGSYTCDIYNNEYLEDIIRYKLKSEWRFVLRKSVIEKFKENRRNRNDILSWVHNVQEYFHISSSSLFKTAHMLDYMLTCIEVPTNMCQLVIIAIIWIVNKYESTPYSRESGKMLSLCNLSYTEKQLLSMEKKVLKIFNCNLNVEEPATFIDYYYYKLGLQNQLAIYCSLYLLECYMFHDDFATELPSVLGAAAVHLFIKSLNPKINWDNMLKESPGFYSSRNLESIEKKMLEQVHKMKKMKISQPFDKYSTKEKLHVSLLFFRDPEFYESHS